MATVLSVDGIRCRTISGVRILFALKMSKSDNFSMEPDACIPKSTVFVPRNTFEPTNIVTPNDLVASVLAVRGNPKIAAPIIQSIPIDMVAFDRWIGDSQDVSVHKDLRFTRTIISRSVYSPMLVFRRPRMLDKFNKISRVHKCIKALCELNIGYAWTRKSKQMLSRFVVLPSDGALFIT